MASRVLCFWTIFVFVLCNSVHPLHIDPQTVWSQFQLQFNKSYATSEEHDRRFGIFEDSLTFIINHNTEEDLGMHSYRLGITPMADLTHEEYEKIYSSCILDNNEEVFTYNESYISLRNCSPPSQFDYRQEGMVTKVKLQKKCNGCYAFSAAGTVETAWMMSTGQLVDLSAQNIIDCSSEFGNLGCDGGHIRSAFAYIQQYGIETESSYPYVDHIQNCSYHEEKVAVQIPGFHGIPPNQRQAVKEAVACVSPVAVGFNDKGKSFKLYKSGIYDGHDCKPTATHAVYVVGYGELNGQLFWILKNSWGPNWGEQGYFRMLSDVCAVLSMVYYPLM